MDGKGQVPLSLSVATPISSAEKDMNTRLSHSPVSPPISPTLHPANVNIKDSLFQGVAGAGEHQAIVAEGRAKRAEYRPVEIIGEGNSLTHGRNPAANRIANYVFMFYFRSFRAQERKGRSNSPFIYQRVVRWP